MPTKKKPTITEIARRRMEVAAQIKALTEEKVKLDLALLDVDKNETYEGDGVALSFTAVHTLDTAFIAKKFPASKRPEFYKLALDTGEFKKHFSPKELETFQRVSHRINVKEL